jgi:hypothetical protein
MYLICIQYSLSIDRRFKMVDQSAQWMRGERYTPQPWLHLFCIIDPDVVHLFSVEYVNAIWIELGKSCQKITEVTLC